MSGHKPFDYDVNSNGRYIYTGPYARKSSVIANQRQSQMVIEAIKKLDSIDKLLDVGCGDGTYTHELLVTGCQKIIGIDPSSRAIEFAKENFSNVQRIGFECTTIEKFIQSGEQFDLVIVRGVLHHCESPRDVINEISKITKYLIILEPNGFNPFLKIIEKISRYHREHGERSFTRFKLQNWLKESNFACNSYQLGITVPFFFPSHFVNLLDYLDKPIRKIPIIRYLFLGTQVITARASIKN